MAGTTSFHAEKCCRLVSAHAASAAADRTAYDIRYSYRPLSGIAVGTMSITYLQFRTEVSFWCPSAFHRLWLNDTSYSKSFSRTWEVNRKSPPRNTTVQLSTPIPNMSAMIGLRFVTDRQTGRRTDVQTAVSCQ